MDQLIDPVFELFQLDFNGLCQFVAAHDINIEWCPVRVNAQDVTKPC
jgi:hypothetical protein